MELPLNSVPPNKLHGWSYSAPRSYPLSSIHRRWLPRRPERLSNTPLHLGRPARPCRITAASLLREPVAQRASEMRSGWRVGARGKADGDASDDAEKHRTHRGRH